MQLFVVTCRGDYCLAVRVIREPNLKAAEDYARVFAKVYGDNWEVQSLSVEGKAETVYRNSYHE